MIDLDSIEDELYTPLYNYLVEKENEGQLARVPQIWKTEQMQRAKKKRLEYPRVGYKTSTPYGTNDNQTTKEKEIVSSDDPDFDQDVQFVYIFTPRITISVQGYGGPNKPVRDSLLLLREWFNIPKLSDRWFGQYEGQVIRSELTEIQDRRAVLETDYEERLGFDAVIEFDDQVKVRESTIETIEIETDDNVESIDT
jgi:hypothetical protein